MAKDKANDKIIKLEISIQSILLVIAVACGFFFIYRVRNVLIMLFWAFVLSSAVMPMVKKLVKMKFPKWLAVTIVYLLLVLLSAGIISAVSVPLAGESIKFVNNIDTIFAKIISMINRVGNMIGLDGKTVDPDLLNGANENWSNNIADNLSGILTAGASGITGIIKLITSLFGGLFNILSVLTISIYITLDHDNFVKTLLDKIPNKKTSTQIHKLITDIETKLGSWIVGQVVLSLTVGVLTWIMLTLLGVQYALPLAILAVLLDSIPNIGATMAALPAIIVALVSGNILQIIGVPTGYILIQQVENNYLGPKIMASAIGLPPIIVILAVLIGAQLYGIPGILLAVPVSAIINLTLEFWAKIYRKD